MGRKIITSILLVMGLFLAAQTALYTAACALMGSWPPPWAFYPVSACVHAAVTAFLLALRGDFVVEPEGKRLEAVNLANVITLVRISTLPTILFLILAFASDGAFGRAELALILSLCAGVFASDLADGLVARLMKQGTVMGRMLDSLSDYLVLAFLSIALLRFGLIHAWFFAILAFRLLFQALGMTAFFLAKRPVTPRPTLAGKAAVASTMVLCGLAVLRAILGRGFDAAFLVFEVAAGAIVGLSVFDKALVFFRHVHVNHARVNDARVRDANLSHESRGQ